jgi:glycosyltransferase involved in cell wall biosynthesis
MKIHQWVPAAHRGDAIGDSARTVREMLRGMGHESDLFALTIDDDLRGDVRPFSDPAAARGDVTIFHFALPSPMTAKFAALDGAKVLQYHNITPAAFFAPYDPQLFRLAALGRRELATLAGHVDLALGDSDFNRRELEELGFTRTGVLPIAVNTERITAAPARPSLERILRDGLINILFVGRIVPNKKIEDHIRLAEVYKRLRRQLLPLHLRRALRRRAAVFRPGQGAHRGVRDAAGPVLVHRAGAGRGPGGVLPVVRRVRLAERA